MGETTHWVRGTVRLGSGTEDQTSALTDREAAFAGSLATSFGYGDSMMLGKDRGNLGSGAQAQLV